MPKNVPNNVIRPLGPLHSFALSAAALVAVAAGCGLSGGSSHTVGAFFSSPRKVSTIKHPVRKDARLAVLWVGQSCTLIQIDDKFVLTDPVFTTTVGQVSKRLVEPGLQPSNLPPIDAVLISHMHFDHLSLGSLAMIENKVRTLIMPRGGVTYLTDFRFPAIELRTWQGWEKDGLRVTAVPVDHVGLRYGIDAAWMTASFTGYVVEYHGFKVYFGGDTAYDPNDFIETQRRFTNIDVALLPIAPIAPASSMRSLYMDPREAVQAFFDLGARWMVPIHHSTFILGDDDPGEPLRQLEIARKRYDLGAREIAVLAIGEQRVFIKAGGKHEDLPKSEPPTVVPSPSPAPAKPDHVKSIPDDDRLD